MSEWTWEDQKKLAEAQHRLMPQHPAGPDMPMEQYIAQADLARNHILNLTARKKKALRDWEKQEVDVLETADQRIAETIAQVEAVTRENAALRAENGRMAERIAELEAKPKKK